MTVHVLGSGVHHNVSSKGEGPAIHGRGEGIVHNQGHAVLVGRLGKSLQIRHNQGRIGQSLREHTLGIGTHGRSQFLFGAGRRHKGGLNAHLLHGLVEQVEGAAVNGAGTYQMIPCRANIQHGHQAGRLTRRGNQRTNAPLQGCNLLLHHIVGGIPQSGVEETIFLQIKQGAHFLGTLIGVCGALHNRGHSGLTVPGLVTRVDTKGIQFVVLHIHSSFPQRGI